QGLFSGLLLPQLRTSLAASPKTAIMCQKRTLLTCLRWPTAWLGHDVFPPLSAHSAQLIRAIVVSRQATDLWRSALFPADGAAQERIAECDEGGHVVVVLAVAVPPGFELIEMGFVSHGLQLGGHLAGVARMGAIVLATRRDQDRRIGVARRSDMIRGKFSEECPILRFVGIAVFVRDCGTDQKLVVATHVDDRHRAEQRAKPLRIARAHIGDQQAAVRPAFRRNAARTGHATPNEIGCDRCEIVVRESPALAARRFVPSRAKFAPTA